METVMNAGGTGIVIGLGVFALLVGAMGRQSATPDPLSDG
jgi:hypothetical protein